MVERDSQQKVERGFSATVLIICLVLLLSGGGFVLGNIFRENSSPGHSSEDASLDTSQGESQPAGKDTLKLPNKLDIGTISLGEPGPRYVVEQMNIITESTADLDDRRTTSYAVPNGEYQPPQVAPFSALLADQVRAWSEEHADQIRQDGTDNELNISWEISVASGSVLAERVHYSGSISGAEPQHSHATFYADLETGQAWAASELLHQLAAERLITRWQILPLEDDFFPASTLTAADMVIDDLTLLASGGVQIALAPGAVAPAENGRVFIDISPDAASPLLSEVGRTLRDRVVQGPLFGDPQDPDPEPAPEPEPESAPEPEPTSDPEPEPSLPEEAENEMTGPVVNPGVTHGVDCSATPCVALTFDDGPGKYTETLLDHLADAGVHATFFVVGKNAQNRPDTLERIVAEGHEVGNHTMGHPDLTKLKTAPLDYEITSTDDIIREVTGLETVLARPPYGAQNDWVLSELGLRNKSTILWDVDTEDWSHRNTRKTVDNVLNQVQDGSIVLMHDIHQSTVAAVPQILQQLQERGYTLVTVSELLGGTTPGDKHYRAER